jgi:Ca-activated chloride channel family protein
MSVDHPFRLLIALLAVVTFAAIYGMLQRRKTAQDLAYSDVAFFAMAAQPQTWVPRALQALCAIALTAVALGVSGPHLRLLLPAKDGAVFICIDTSGSMSSTDVVPSRAEAAKAAARAFIEQSTRGTKIGIISFSGAAGIVVPLNDDRAATLSGLDEIPSPDGATAIGDALMLAGKFLPKKGHRAVVLITDGVNNAGTDPLEAAQTLGRLGVPVYTIGIGTTSGSLIPGTQEEATIDEDALRSYAQVSGGAYSRAENATQLRDALQRLGRITTLQPQRVDAALPLLGGGAVVLAGVLLLGLGLGRFP